MKNAYFKGIHPNFGDDLNSWLWPRIFPDLFDEDEETVFLGIGSIIGEKQYSNKVNKIVFGSGFVPEYHHKPTVNGADWRVYFVRGPRTAKLLGLPPDLALGDSAILLRTLVDMSRKTGEFISFMPHWESVERGNWAEVCSLAGVHFIDPRGPVEDIIDDILRSRLIITEAMHGAIVADAFRIPWIPILPLNKVHRSKWFDWAEALNIDLQPRRICPSTLKEARLSFLRRPIMASPFSNLIENGFKHLAAFFLRRLTTAAPCLSNDAVIKNITTRMVERVEELRRDHKKKLHADNGTQISIKPAKVAVIIAAYNARDTIIRAIESALQEPEAGQVIVIDDASTDDTVAQSSSCDDGSGRLKIISLTKNGGPSVARNHALKEVNATWVSVLDADDFFLPGRLKGLLEYEEKADFIADDIWRVNEKDINGPRHLFLGEALSRPRMVSFNDFVSSNITDSRRPRGELGFIKPIMRRSFFELHELHYQEHMRLGEDYELYSRALALGAKLMLVPAQGYVSVVRTNSLSGTHSEQDLHHLRDCDDFLATIPNLSKFDKMALREHYLSVDCRLQWRMLILAVKKGDIARVIKTFFRPMPVPFYLLNKVFEQFCLRIGKRIKV